ncbi:hypothetical protein H4Q26_011617 [Puccinia striiformis f. sp. tritici PST-130]|uniref:Uncharacterized protein n=2 Tax=Puccinia striiformis TaxID=27350 RepID=A0A0L0VWP3_9BASI|nr:hypothetical protein H4Q26_011617 [Puccinia striiformis f. sp. tritici PST-130]KNF03691.1 hypothetical protein PSTG_03212 [Puccinia striiformis f. sp. tritici PST-78]POW14518.1 hypothetical protein PSTT_02894 [Puccinia striiformis]
MNAISNTLSKTILLILIASHLVVTNVSASNCKFNKHKTPNCSRPVLEEDDEDYTPEFNKDGEFICADGTTPGCCGMTEDGHKCEDLDPEDQGSE